MDFGKLLGGLLAKAQPVARGIGQATPTYTKNAQNAFSQNLNRGQNFLDWLDPFGSISNASYVANKEAETQGNGSNLKFANDWLGAFLNAYAQDKTDTGKGIFSGKEIKKKGYGDIVEDLGPNLSQNQKRALGFAGEFATNVLPGAILGGIGAMEQAGTKVPTALKPILKAGKLIDDPLEVILSKGDALLSPAARLASEAPGKVDDVLSGLDSLNLPNVRRATETPQINPQQARNALEAVIPSVPENRVIDPMRGVMGGETGDIERKFATTLKQSDNTLPETKQIMEQMDLTYKRKPNVETIETARNRVLTNEDEALKIAKSNEISDDANATRMLLLNKYQQEGQWDKVAEFASLASRSGTESGRATQIFAAWNKLTPEGALRTAQKDLDYNFGNGRKIERAKTDLESIKQTFTKVDEDFNKFLDDIDSGKVKYNRVSIDLGQLGKREIDSPYKQTLDQLEKAQVEADTIRAASGDTQAIDRKVFDLKALANKQQIDEIRVFHKKFFGDSKLNVQFLDRILTEDGGAAWGKYQKGWIDLVGGDFNTVDTYVHESVHKALDTFSTQGEKQKVIDFILKNKQGEKLPWGDIVKDQATAEEWLAENFKSYIKGKGKYDGTIKGFFQRVWNNLKAVVGKRNEVDAFYSKLNSGSLAKRGEVNANPLLDAVFRQADNVDSQVRQGLRQSDVKLSDLVRQHMAEVDRTGKGLAETIVREKGLSPEEAKRLEDVITKRFKELVVDKKRSILEQRLKPKNGAAKSQIQSLLEDINLGTFDDNKFLPILEKKYGIKAIDPKSAETIVQKANLVQSLPEGSLERQNATIDLMREVAKASKTKMQKLTGLFDTMRYGNMLSSPKTQTVNFTNNFGQTLITAPATRFFEGINDAVWSTMSRKEREVFAGEAGRQIMGSLGSIPEALENFYKTFNGTAISDNSFDLTRLPSGNKFVRNTFEVPGRLLQSFDEFFQTMLKGGEMEALGYRERKLGTVISNKEELASKQAKYFTYNSDLDTKPGASQGKVLTAIDRSTDKILQWGHDVPALRMFVPFIKVPMNVLKQGIEYTPGLGLSTLIGNESKSTQLAKQAVGGVTLLTAAYMAHVGDATWNVPTNKKEREAWEAANRQPYSIKIGDKWVSYDRLGTLGFPMALAGAVKAYYEQDPKSYTNSEIQKATNVIGGLAKYFSDQSFMKGLGDLVKASQGDQYAASSLPANFVNQGIPASSLINWVNSNFIDKVRRKPENMGDAIKMRLPGLSQQVAAFTDPEGNAMERDNIGINAWSPVNVRNAGNKYEDYYQLIQGRKLDKELENVQSSLLEGKITQKQADAQTQAISKAKDSFDQNFTQQYGYAPVTNTRTYNDLLTQIGITPAPKASKSGGSLPKMGSKPKKGRKIKVKKPKKVRSVRSKKIKVKKVKKKAFTYS